ncbi:unnamed protein product [marine sediment metagenome]|uniref:Thermosome subunit n=1 Tax=marine sediment metagenome TaxID=412755 RepID=X1DN39_9ZZZZ
MAQLGGTPVLIMREGTERQRGRDAMSNNIAAAIVIAEAVRTSLGPMGMDKMLVDQFGDVVITNDGATILIQLYLMILCYSQLTQTQKFEAQKKMN